MTTTVQAPLPLPASVIPEGCLPLDSEQARRWAAALRVPVRLGMNELVGVVLAGLAVSGGLTLLTDAPPFAAVLPGLMLLWLVLRPEVVALVAPGLALLLVLPWPGLGWPGILGTLLVLALMWVTVVLRLVARRRQRAVALAAAGGVTAVLPDKGKAFRRGKFLAWFGVVLAAAGAGTVATVGLGEGRLLPTAGCQAIGLGCTAVLSGLVSRRRAAALRRAPAPVLRVLVRENADVDTEVYAADDLGALRPLFTVSVAELDDEGEPFFERADDDDEDDEEAQEEAEAEIQAALDRIEDERPGPLREAVLYGLPYDSAEILLVSADEKPGEPPLIERSQGPVRPLSEGFRRRRLVGEKRAGSRKAAYRELGRMAADAAVGEIGSGAVRRWRAGWLDRVVVVALVLWFGQFLWGETDWVLRYVMGGTVALIGAALLPHRLAWTVTADSEGLWFNGFRRTRHIAWDDIRVVRCKGVVLKVDSDRPGFPTWTVDGLRWPRLELRRGWIHPYERIAAEITAMWRDPALRPAVEASGKERGRPLWPLAVGLGVVFVAGLVLLP